MVAEVNVYVRRGVPRAIDCPAEECRRVIVMGKGRVAGSDSGVGSSDMTVNCPYGLCDPRSWDLVGVAPNLTDSELPSAACRSHGTEVEGLWTDKAGNAVKTRSIRLQHHFISLGHRLFPIVMLIPRVKVL